MRPAGARQRPVCLRVSYFSWTRSLHCAITTPDNVCLMTSNITTVGAGTQPGRQGTVLYKYMYVSELMDLLPGIGSCDCGGWISKSKVCAGALGGRKAAGTPRPGTSESGSGEA